MNVKSAGSVTFSSLLTIEIGYSPALEKPRIWHQWQFSGDGYILLGSAMIKFARSKLEKQETLLLQIPVRRESLHVLCLKTTARQHISKRALEKALTTSTL
jgi:hypothetical protein